MNGTTARITVRTVLIAAPLALGALTATAAPALAAPPSPIDFSQPEEGDPPLPPVPNPDIPPGPGDVVAELPHPCHPDDVCFPPPDDDPPGAGRAHQRPALSDAR